MYVISPWSKGGWVNSEVFDHTSVGRFLERRFGVTIPAISRWHRAVCGDLTSAFDFKHPESAVMPPLPDASDSERRVADAKTKPKPVVPASGSSLFQEGGTRPSRALPYELDVSARSAKDGALELTFRNSGTVGAVFHVYDKLHLERIPRRYTVEAGKEIADTWSLTAEYDLWVLGPNGFLRELRGKISDALVADEPVVDMRYDVSAKSVRLVLSNPSRVTHALTIFNSVYGSSEPKVIEVPPGRQARHDISLADSHLWYDLTVSSNTSSRFMRRFAGRLETGAHSVSDPAMVTRVAQDVEV